MLKERELEKALATAKEQLIVVEGKNDKAALEELGFISTRIFVIHEDGRSLYEKIEEVETKAGRKKVCILTDFDKKGRQLYFLLKAELNMRGVRLNNRFRSVVMRLRVSHIEGLSTYFFKNALKAQYLT